MYVAIIRSDCKSAVLSDCSGTVGNMGDGTYGTEFAEAFGWPFDVAKSSSTGGWE